MRRICVIPLSALLLLYTWSGCATGRSDLLARYDALPYTDVFVYAAPATDVMRAISEAVLDRGGSITMIEPQTGILTAELVSLDPLPEENHISALEEEESLIGAILAGIVAVFIFIILFGWLGDGCGDDDEEKSRDDTSRERGRKPKKEPERIHNREWLPDITLEFGAAEMRPVTDYRYVLTFTTLPGQSGNTRVRIRALRHESSNGTTIRSTKMKNKYLLYGLDEKIRNELSRK